MQTGVHLQARPQRLVHVQRQVRILARVLRGANDIHLVKADLLRTFATQVFKAQTLATQMAFGQAFQAMRFMYFEYIALQHGVVHIATHFYAVVGKHMAVVFHMLPQLGLASVLQPGLEQGQHFFAV